MAEIPVRLFPQDPDSSEDGSTHVAKTEADIYQKMSDMFRRPKPVTKAEMDAYKAKRPEWYGKKS